MADTPSDGRVDESAKRIRINVEKTVMPILESASSPLSTSLLAEPALDALGIEVTEENVNWIKPRIARCSGPVTIEISGKLVSLVGLAEWGSTRSVQLDSKNPIQQDLTKRTWQVATSIRNEPPLAGKYLDKAHVVAALKAAPAPLSTDRIIELVVRASGEPATRTRLKSRRARVTQCLEYLRDEGDAIMSNVPLGRSRQRQWALAERQQEFWPAGPPTQDGLHVDTPHVVALLRDATDLVTSAEIAKHVLGQYGAGERKPPFENVRLRVRHCLDFHRRQGTVRAILRPGNRNIGWVLAEREQELCPPEIPADGFAYSAGVVAALEAKQGPMTCREIAIHMINAEGKKSRSSEIRALASRIWGCLQHHALQGTVHEIALPGRNGRCRAWVLASAADTGSEYQSTDDARVISILSSASAAMIVPEIVNSLLSLRGDPVTERNVRQATARVLGYLRRFCAEGIAREIRIEGSRFRGWVLVVREINQEAAE